MKLPTRADLLASAGKTTQDLIAPNLRLLFCGINPGLVSSYTGNHFARPGNRFWLTLYAAGFTERLLAPAEEHELLRIGIGITNLATRATAAADELSRAELIAGAEHLRGIVREYTPRTVAMLGISAYRIAFARPRALMGKQPEPLESAEFWILPNPSGLNAHYTPKDLAGVFRAFRIEAGV